MNDEQQSSAADEIIALERAMLARWYSGDPKELLELCDTDVTYFDPTVSRRIDGLQALEEHLLPLTGKVNVDVYELLNPKVQFQGDAVVLTYNMVVHWEPPDGSETQITTWNAVDVYSRIEGNWKIVHSNWAFAKPVDKLV